MKTHKPQIIHVIDSLTTGGAEILLKNSINSLTQFQYLVVVLYPNYTLQSAFRGDIDFICLDHKGWRGSLTTIKKLRKIIKQNKPLLVHSHLLTSNLITRLATPSSVPLYNSIHSTYSIDAFQKNSKSIWAERLTLKKRHTLIAVSNHVLEDYKRFVPFRGNAFVLHNFLPDQFYLNAELKTDAGAFSKKINCVALGSLKEAKNYHYLFDLFSKLRDEEIALDIYGEGTLHKELQDRIDKEKLPIVLQGHANVSPELLRKYDLFVQASVHEGFGLSVIEALAARVPIFISDLPVFHEVSGNFAHFFSLTDLPSAITSLKNLCENENLRKQFVEEGYQHCKRNYSFTTYKNKLLAIYNSKHQAKNVDE